MIIQRGKYSERHRKMQERKKYVKKSLYGRMEDDGVVDRRWSLHIMQPSSESKKKKKGKKVKSFASGEKITFRKSERTDDTGYVQQLWPDRETEWEREKRPRDTMQGYCPFCEVGSSHIRATTLSLSMSSKEKAGEPADYVGINTAQQVTFEANYIAPATLPPPSPSPLPPSSSLLCSSPPSLLSLCSPLCLAHWSVRVVQHRWKLRRRNLPGGCCCCCRWCTERTGVWGLPSNPSFSHRPPWRTAPVWDHTTTIATTTITITAMVPPSARVVR